MLTESLLLLRSTTDLLKNKSRPEAAAQEAAAWVQSERAMREKLKREREARELKEKLEVSYPIQIDYRDPPVPIRRARRHPSSVRRPALARRTRRDGSRLMRVAVFLLSTVHIVLTTSLALQREQRKKELLQKEKEAAELKKLEEAEAARKAAAGIIVETQTVLLPAPEPAPLPPAVEAEKENSGAHNAAEDDESSTEDEDEGSEAHPVVDSNGFIVTEVWT